MTNSALTDEDIDCLYGTLRLLLQQQRSGIIRSLAGNAGFDLGMIRDGITDGGIQRKEMLADIDGQWNAWDRRRKERTLPRLANTLANHAGIPAGIDVVNSRKAHCGFKFINGGFVPVNAVGEIPA